MPQEPDTVRIERIAGSAARKAVEDHSKNCGAAVQLMQVDRRLSAIEEGLLPMLQNLQSTLKDMDRKLLGGEYEFKDVNRKIEAVDKRMDEAEDHSNNRFSAIEKKQGDWETYWRGVTTKVILTVIGAVAAGVLAIKFIPYPQYQQKPPVQTNP